MLPRKRESYMNVEEDGDNFYVNVVINHNNSNGAQPSLATFSQNFTNVIIDDPSQWFLSVIRFSIGGQLIPIFIFPIAPFPNTDPNKSPFSVTMEYNGNFSPQEFVEYVPNNPYPVPPGPSALNPNQTITNYYFVYAYQYMLDMVNTTIAAAFGAIPGGVPMGSLPPYFIYDPNTQLISLIAQSTFYDETLAKPIKLYMNTALQNYFDAIPVHFLGYDGFPSVTPGQNFLFQIKDEGNNYYYPPGGQTIVNNVIGAQISLTTTGVTILPPIQWYQMKQEYNVLAYWNSFKNIVFTSGTIPIQYEQAPINNTMSNTSASGTSNFFPILTDFNPLISQLAAGAVRSIFQYYVSGPYRLIDLNSHIPLRKVDIQLYWQDNFNNLYPLYIQNGNSINIKLLFVKKDLYKSTHK